MGCCRAEFGGGAGLAALLLASVPHGPRARDAGAILGVATLAILAAACGLAYGWFWHRSVHLVFPIKSVPGYGAREIRATQAAVRSGLQFAGWSAAGGTALAGLWLRTVWAGRAAGERIGDE